MSLVKKKDALPVIVLETSIMKDWSGHVPAIVVSKEQYCKRPFRVWSVPLMRGLSGHSSLKAAIDKANKVSRRRKIKDEAMLIYAQKLCNKASFSKSMKEGITFLTEAANILMKLDDYRANVMHEHIAKVKNGGNFDKRVILPQLEDYLGMYSRNYHRLWRLERKNDEIILKDSMS
jgi:hypothetical protein